MLFEFFVLDFSSAIAVVPGSFIQSFVCFAGGVGVVFAISILTLPFRLIFSRSLRHHRGGDGANQINRIHTSTYLEFFM